jgi:carbon monoxide dehydrogenase subunit G
MHFEGTQRIQAPIEKVWQTLLDPAQLGPCMPGFQSLEVVDAQHFKAKVGVGIAAIKANFTLDVAMKDLEPPRRATATAHGVAPISAVDVTSSIALEEPAPGRTQLTWSADVVVSGTLAGLGARLMQSTAQKMTGQFFTCLSKKLEPATPTG